MTYEEANTFCSDNGGDLVEPRTFKASKAVDRACNDIGGADCSWIKLRCQDGTDESCYKSPTDWKWDSDKALLTSGWINHFASAEDNTLDGGNEGERCAVFWKRNEAQTFWKSASCDDTTTYKALCVIKDPTPAPIVAVDLTD